MRDLQGVDPRRTLRGITVGPGMGRALHRSDEGRVCGDPDCRTVLSVYNDDAFCWQHTAVRPYFVRAPRRTAEELVG